MPDKNIEVDSARGALVPAGRRIHRQGAHQAGGSGRAACPGEGGPRGLLGGAGRTGAGLAPALHASLDDSRAPNYRWFTDGQLNVSYNCLDVHLAERGHKTAIIFEGEPGDVRRLTYRELHAEVCRFANALQGARACGRGDRVVIYMPLVPEAIVAMHACARIGAIHSVVFGGFSALSLRDRIEDARREAGDHRRRRLARRQHRSSSRPRPTRRSPAAARPSSRSSCCERTGKPVAMKCRPRHVVARRDRRASRPICEPGVGRRRASAVPAVHLRLHRQAQGHPALQRRLSAGAKLTTQWVFDLREDDVFWCTADVGWVTGHSYVAYGPLAAGATVVLYEGAPTFPDGGRFWKICQTHGVTIFYTAPTAIRALMKLGDEMPAQIRPVAPAPARQCRRADQSGGLDVVSPRDRRASAVRSSIPGGRPRPARS